MNFAEAAELIKKAIHPEDLFPIGEKEATKKLYRILSVFVHPDKNGDSDESKELFTRLGQLYEQVLLKIEEGRYGVKHIATIESKKRFL